MGGVEKCRQFGCGQPHRRTLPEWLAYGIGAGTSVHATALPWLAPRRPLATFKTTAAGMLGRCVVAEADSAGLVGFAAWNGAEWRSCS